MRAACAFPPPCCTRRTDGRSVYTRQRRQPRPRRAIGHPRTALAHPPHPYDAIYDDSVPSPSLSSVWYWCAYGRMRIAARGGGRVRCLGRVSSRARLAHIDSPHARANSHSGHTQVRRRRGQARADGRRTRMRPMRRRPRGRIRMPRGGTTTGAARFACATRAHDVHLRLCDFAALAFSLYWCAHVSMHVCRSSFGARASPPRCSQRRAVPTRREPATTRARTREHATSIARRRFELHERIA
jgi:hypothetical protein